MGNTDWRVATGTGSPRYPFMVARVRDDRDEVLRGDGGHVRRFASKDAAERAATRLQRTSDMDDAREHARLAVHHLIRATDHLTPGHPLVAVLQTAADVYLDLTGHVL